MTATIRTGRIDGSVMCQNTCSRFAPSVAAACLSSCGTLSRPTSSSRAWNGMPVHMSEMMTAGMASEGVPSQTGCGRCARDRK